jgi:lipopolysaccharide/colanic/teichoic acid biosynthesis glycosyltransferase
LLDIGLSLVALVLLSPVFLLTAFSIRLFDGSPILFRQQRVGRDGARFTLLKFRTMTSAAPDPLAITTERDPRVTRLGEFLRNHKLDELPQFLAVLSGKMSIVGPRPDVPAIIDGLPVDARAVLRFKPGITSETTLLFSSETQLLAATDDSKKYYREVIAPMKARLATKEMQQASLRHYVTIVFRTVGFIRGPSSLGELQEVVYRELGTDTQ